MLTLFTIGVFFNPNFRFNSNALCAFSLISIIFHPFLSQFNSPIKTKTEQKTCPVVWNLFCRVEFNCVMHLVFWCSWFNFRAIRVFNSHRATTMNKINSKPNTFSWISDCIPRGRKNESVCLVPIKVQRKLQIYHSLSQLRAAVNLYYMNCILRLYQLD